MKKNDFVKKLNLKYPVIQAPMAGGITSPELVAASASAGVLGMFGAGYMTAEQLRKDIRQIPENLRQHIGVNIFIPQSYQVDQGAVDKMKNHLMPYYRQYQIDPEEIKLGQSAEDLEKFNQQIQVVIEEALPFVSFTFGAPASKMVETLKSHGITVAGTATHFAEAIHLAGQGVDAIVVQNKAAGGHQATFMADEGNLSIKETLIEIKKAVDIPLIASGGIMSRGDIEAMQKLGAAAVQMGTAFLLTEESGAHPLHKSAIIAMQEDDTVLTEAFSGRQARGVKNEFIEKISKYEDDFLPYPILNRLTQPIRRAAKAKGDVENLSLWSGVKGYQGRRQTVEELVAGLSGDHDDF